MITTEQIKQLSTAEKLQVMETLWQELTTEGADQLASPVWHQQALQQTENASRRPVADQAARHMPITFR